MKKYELSHNDLKFMQEKTGSLSASKWVSYLRNMQCRGCDYGPFGFYI